ncbi:MAG: phosphate/phosphite/phosphonate ABC transporter substrate-binding protein, partial [Deltaproteobacteria bacterium]|nr:phosphate/phosphite/phosphonate ABC transporter substrate-binding protein [Deltaproteobacteria bacterium]
SDFILLNQFEWANVSRLKIAWVAGLEVLAESQKISSAPVVTFPNVLNPEESAALKQAFLKVGQDASAQATLQEMRMKGFKAASSPD